MSMKRECAGTVRERKRERELYSSEIKRKEGITLVALVVTIVVLLILAGITIIMLFGENGVINKASSASIKTKLGEIEEVAGLILTDLNMKKYTEDPSIDTSIGAIVEELRNKGYEIKEVSTEGSSSTVTGITLENSSIDLKPGESIDIEVNFERSESEGGNDYYVVVEGKNYKINTQKGGISIENEPSEITEGSVVEEILTASSSDNKVTVSVPNPKGSIITVTAGSKQVENVTITINYGEEGKPVGAGKSKTCTVKVLPPPVTAASIASAIDKSEYYGKTVSGYTCENGDAVANWKIFYAGNEFSTDGQPRIYLIADDYIARDKIPASTVEGGTGHTLNAGHDDYPKTAYFTNILGDYTGSASITDERLKKLNNSYYSQNYESTNDNMKAVAYMMDTTAWGVYKDENKAEYAIGGPTVEMLMKSYSEKHNVNYQAKVINNIGYQISQDGGTTWELICCNRMLDKDDRLYVIEEYGEAGGWRLASPNYDINSVNHVLTVTCVGDVGADACSEDYLAFRPLVCLNSDVEMEKQSDGSYLIK